MTRLLSWLSTNWWIFIIAATLCITGWNHSARIAHTTYVSNQADGDKIAIDETSPTGYELGFRKLVVPEKHADSFQWIMQVQSMFEQNTWRLKHVDFDNAPEGRSVRTSSLYRWWLGGIAWIDHTISSNPIGISVERAALVADPIPQLITLLFAAIVITRFFNGWLATLFSVGFVTLFPLGTAYAAAQPDDSSLLLALTICSVLLLAAGLSKVKAEQDPASKKSIRRLFFSSGVLAGLGMWIGVAGMLPILVGIVLAGILLGFLSSRKTNQSTEPLPWRAWAIGGAAITLLAWLVDRSPSLLDSSSWQSDFVHPLYSLAWLSCGEFLRFFDTPRKSPARLTILTLSFSAIAICGLVYTILFHGSLQGWSIDPVSARLTRLPNDPGAANLLDWLKQYGGKAMLFATILPVALLVAGVTALVRAKSVTRDAKMIAIVLGPTVFAMILATSEAGWWSQTGALALTLAVVTISSSRTNQTLRWTVRSIVVFAAIMGVSFVYTGLGKQSRNTVERAEIETLIERHLAQWLARRGETENDGALAPPNVSVALAYFGGLRVLGTPYPENADGFSVAVRLSAASSADEARALTTGREINLIIHPSWDTFLEDYARLGSEQPESSFIALLNRWLPPRWLEPVEFQLPKVPGFENEWVTIFRTVEVQDNASAIGHLVEYFLYSGRSELARRAQAALASNFPDDLVTHITAAELALASGDRTAFNRSADTIIELIDSGADFYLTWEFRVSMSLVLAGAKRIEEAKEQLERCLDEADTNSIRRLPEGSLSGLLRLAKALKLDFPDPDQRQYALSLLSAGLKAELETSP